MIDPVPNLTVGIIVPAFHQCRPCFPAMRDAFIHCWLVLRLRLCFSVLLLYLFDFFSSSVYRRWVAACLSSLYFSQSVMVFFFYFRRFGVAWMIACMIALSLPKYCWVSDHWMLTCLSATEFSNLVYSLKSSCTVCSPSRSSRSNLLPLVVFLWYPQATIEMVRSISFPVAYLWTGSVTWRGPCFVDT